MEIIFWLVVLVLLLALEAMTTSLVSIWFALGALAALISASIAPSLWWLQILWFIVISTITLLTTRPLARKYVRSSKKETNADRYVGVVGVVTETVDNLAATGTVKVMEKLWTARSENGEVIPQGERVNTIRIEGVKLIVSPADSKKPVGTGL